MVAGTIEHFDPITIWIEGKVVPYTRMTQRGKYVKPDAIRYIESQNRLKNAIMLEGVSKDVLGEYHVPEKAGFRAHIDFNVASLHHCDLDNLVKAVMDACQGVLFKDDRYCDMIYATRIKCEPKDEGVRIWIYEMDDDIPF